MFEDTNPRDLKQLLAQIHTRECALPEFQRDFVWDPGATKELIVSIAKGFPAGSLLRIRNSDGGSLFEYRQFEGAPALNGHRPTYLVLDGQQRLTSLYQAFYGVGAYKYFVDLARLLGEEEFDECIFSVKETRPLARRYSQLSAQAEDLVLPLSVLKDEMGGFSQWVLDVSSTRHRDEAEAMVEMQQELQQKIQNSWIKTIDSYQFPVVTLLGSTGAEAVCTIFETLNRTGVKLTAFDLLTARFWPQQINLRGEWEDAQDNFPILKEMEIDPYYLLQALSLCARPTPGCKRGEVLDLKGDEFRAWWPTVAESYANAMEILQEECGVLAPKWLPYAAIPIPMAAVLAKFASTVGPATGTYRARLIRWYWCSVLNQSYENPPNSQAAKDFNEITNWFNGGPSPEAIRNFDIDEIESLRRVTFKQRALYRGLMGLVLTNEPRDFHTQKRITAEVLRGESIDDHHIFPAGWFSDNHLRADAVDSILNRTLIDSETNKRIGKNPPSKYLSEIETPSSEVNLATILESHLCAIALLQEDDYESFWNNREERIQAMIRSVTS